MVWALKKYPWIIVYDRSGVGGMYDFCNRSCLQLHTNVGTMCSANLYPNNNGLGASSD